MSRFAITRSRERLRKSVYSWILLVFCLFALFMYLLHTLFTPHNEHSQSGLELNILSLGFDPSPPRDEFLSWRMPTKHADQFMTSSIRELRRCAMTCIPYLRHPCETECPHTQDTWGQFRKFIESDIENILRNRSYRTALSILQTYEDYGTANEAVISRLWMTLTEQSRWELSVWAYANHSLCVTKLLNFNSEHSLLYKNDIMLELQPLKFINTLKKVSNVEHVNILGCVLLRNFKSAYRCNIFSTLEKHFPRAQKSRVLLSEFCDEVSDQLTINKFSSY